MSEQAEQVLDSRAAPSFRGSLVRTVVLGLLIVSLIPILVIGTASYLRTRQFMLDQAATQIQTVADYYSSQLISLSNSRQEVLANMMGQQNFHQDILTVYQGAGTPGYSTSLRSITEYLNSSISTPTEDIFSLIAVVDSAGEVIASSRSSLVGKTLTQEHAIVSMYQTDQNTLMINPGGYFPNDLVLVTTKLYRNPLGGPGLTFVGFSAPSMFTDLLRNADLLFPSTHAFLITTTNQYAGFNPIQQRIGQETFAQAYKETLNQYGQSAQSGETVAYVAQNNVPVRSSITRIKEIQSTLVIEVPDRSIFGQLQSLLPFILILLAVSLLLTGLITGFGARSIVVPLVDLARHARDFASGDWSFRAKVKRNDEIGLLGYSFNVMVQQLTDFYHSLEARVEDRTRQMRTATEIAQEAVAAPSRVEIFQRSVKLLAERFGFSIASIYLLDENSQNAVLTEQSSQNPENKLPELNRVPVNTASVIGWVAKNKQARLEENIPLEKSTQQLTFQLPNTRSEIVVPIILSNEVIGVLDLQSAESGIFDSESVSIFNAFTTQISAGLRNVQAMEASVSNFQQAAVFARFEKLITKSESREEVLNHVTDLFNQTSFVCFFMDVLQDQVQLATLTDPKGTRLDQSLKGFTIPFSKGIAHLAEGLTIFIESLNDESDYAGLNSYFTRRGCKSSALIPIMEGENLLHVIAVGSREKTPVSPQQVQPIASIAESIGAVLEKLRLENMLSQRDRELSTLDAISKNSTTESDLHSLAERLHKQVTHAMGDPVGFALALFRQGTDTIEIPYYNDQESVSANPYVATDDLFSQTITKGQVKLVNEVSTLGLRTIHSPELSLTTQSFLSVPLKIGDQVIGAIAMLDNQNPRRFTDADAQLLTTIAPQVSINIQNSELLSARLKALQAYDQERFLFNSLLNHTPDRVEFKDLNGGVIRYSQAAMIPLPTEATSEQESGQTVLSESDLQLMESGESLLGEIEKHSGTDGNDQWELVSKIPLRDADGTINGLLTIGRDITDLKNTEQLAEYRAKQLLTASEIARDTSSGSQEISDLLERLVQLVRDRFGFYHSSIFLLDKLGQFAVLRESTGDAGDAMKQRGHKLAVGSASIIGQTTLNGTPVIVNDVSQEANYYPNPLLPETRSEAGIPLIHSNQVIGALDVQSTKVNAFTEDDIRILQVMGDQLAIAIQNAELFTRTESSLSRHRLLHQITAAAGKSSTIDDAIRSAVETLHLTMTKDQITYWSPLKSGKLAVKAYAGLPDISLASSVLNIGESAVGTSALRRITQRIDEKSSEASKLPVNPESQSLICVPVTYKDRLLGVINVESIETAAYDETDQEIITTLADNLASIISNIELVDQVRLQVDRQQQLYEITSKIRRSVDIETIMQTSVSEIAHALNIKHASIEITAGRQDFVADPFAAPKTPGSMDGE